jgi:FKBP-type peptidyl-prolyl cis-trans isomerase (trigger factor)
MKNNVNQLPQEKSYFTREQRRNTKYHGEMFEHIIKLIKQEEKAIIQNIRSLNAVNADVTQLLRYAPAESIIEGDYVVVDYLARLVEEDGSLGPSFGGGANKGMTIKNLGNGELVEGFEEQLIGKKPGDTLEVDVTFPEDYHQHLAGKKAKFFVAILEVLREPTVASYIEEKQAELNKYNEEQRKKHEESLKKAKETAEKEAVENN